MPRTTRFIAVVALIGAGCSGPIVNTGENAPQTEAPTPPTSSTRPSNEKLVNAFDYYVKTDNRAGYYFSSPSGRWRCVIVPRTWTGCRSAASPARIAITGAPRTVTDDQGQTTAPNSIVVRTLGDPQFASLPADLFKPASGKAKTLEYDKILAAAGFRCNVQEQTGISCLSEETDNGFTFSADGASWQYTDVP